MSLTSKPLRPEDGCQFLLKVKEASFYDRYAVVPVKYVRCKEPVIGMKPIYPTSKQHQFEPVCGKHSDGITISLEEFYLRQAEYELLSSSASDL